jgi:hypothetical protein
VNSKLGNIDDPSNDRYRLINNHGEIIKHGDIIDDIKKKGHEAAGAMRDNNRELAS